MRQIALAVTSLVMCPIVFAGTVPMPPLPNDRKSCTAQEHRQFDFMAGGWQVGPTGQTVAPSRAVWDIRSNGCSVHEAWFPKSGAHGNSMNYYDAADKKWHQHWIGADGDAVHYVGAWTGSKMEFRAEDIATPQMTNVVLTMTFEPLPDGSVRQSGTQSTDGGKTFQPSFDLTYRKGK